MKRFALVLAVLAFGCASAPPNLTPQAHTAFHNTQVIKALDLIRDIAIDANAQQPELLSTDTTRMIVQYHKASLVIIKATDTGWKTAIIAATEEVLKNLPPNEKALLTPYVTLALVTLKGLTQ